MTFDPEKFQLTIARFQKHGDAVELVIDADNAFAYREGTLIDTKDIVQYDKIFSDAQKGQLASPDTIKKLFGDKANEEIVKQIIEDGEIHFTANFLKQKREKKKRQIVAFLHEQSLDPKTKLPHPTVRIESAMENIKYNIDPFGPTDQQAATILQELKKILPIAISMKKIQIIVPAQYAAKVHGKLLGFGGKQKESWMSDGSLLYVAEISAGAYERMSNYLQEATHGNAEIEDVS
jgi:ribosome maturation protein SDO1